MKRLKFLVSTVVMVLLMAGIYACVREDGSVKSDNASSLYDVQTEIRDIPCEDRLGNCSDSAWTTVTTNVSIDLYPGCTFEVKYKYRSCPIGKFDVQIVEWGDWPPCAAFNADIV